MRTRTTKPKKSKKIRKPLESFKIKSGDPSRETIAYVQTVPENRYWVILESSSFGKAKSVRDLAAWLIKAADYLESKEEK